MTPHERKEWLNAILKLPELQAQVIVRYYLRQESQVEICQSLKITELRFHQTHFEALESLRSSIA